MLARLVCALIDESLHVVVCDRAFLDSLPGVGERRVQPFGSLVRHRK